MTPNAWFTEGNGFVGRPDASCLFTMGITSNIKQLADPRMTGQILKSLTLHPLGPCFKKNSPHESHHSRASSLPLDISGSIHFDRRPPLRQRA